MNVLKQRSIYLYFLVYISSEVNIRIKTSKSNSRVSHLVEYCEGRSEQYSLYTRQNHLKRKYKAEHFVRAPENTGIPVNKRRIRKYE